MIYWIMTRLRVKGCRCVNCSLVVNVQCHGSSPACSLFPQKLYRQYHSYYFHVIRKHYPVIKARTWHIMRFNTIYDLFMMDPIGFTLPLLFGINDHIQIVRGWNYPIMLSLLCMIVLRSPRFSPNS
ncbi:hypothetical protein EV424DRAFT_747193 [Suillus variegatus]|nr:hypothetical protein EV424DRAFT_747193 [Suillus variegatus]